jgi:hypothetical protein
MSEQFYSFHYPALSKKKPGNPGRKNRASRFVGNRGDYRAVVTLLPLRLEGEAARR